MAHGARLSDLCSTRQHVRESRAHAYRLSSCGLDGWQEIFERPKLRATLTGREHELTPIRMDSNRALSILNCQLRFSRRVAIPRPEPDVDAAFLTPTHDQFPIVASPRDKPPQRLRSHRTQQFLTRA